jgi:hypothetical protein
LKGTVAARAADRAAVAALNLISSGCHTRDIAGGDPYCAARLAARRGTLKYLQGVTMLTFLFLVGFVATTLLLLAIALDEALRVTRMLLARWWVRRELAAPVMQARIAAIEGLPARAAAARARVLPSEPGDWDRAA